MVQEAFAALWSHRGEVEECKGKSYLLGTIYRRVADWHRHRHVEREHSDSLRGDAATHPDESFDLREAIGKALATLPDNQRAILQLRDVEGYTYSEIAHVLGLTADQVQVYLFRARVKMQKQLIQLGYDNHQ